MLISYCAAFCRAASVITCCIKLKLHSCVDQSACLRLRRNKILRSRLI